MKKSWLLLVIALVGCLIIYVFIQLSRLKNFDHNGKSLKAIPASAAIIVKSKNIDHLQNILNDEIEFKTEFFSSAIIKSAINPINFIDTLLKNNTGLEEFKFLPLYSSFHSEGKDNISTLHLIELRNKKQENRLISFIESAVSQSFNILERQYNSNTIYEFNKPDSKSPFFVSVSKGMVMASFSNLLIETSLRQISSGEDWSNSVAFQTVKKTASSTADINIFVNTNHLPKILKTHTNKDFHKNLDKLKSQSEWGELDVEFKNDGVLTNGFFTNNSDGIFGELLNISKARRSNTIEFLPGSTRGYISYSFDSGEKLAKSISKFQKKSSAATFKNKYGKDIEEQFFSMLAGNIALAHEVGSKTNSGILIFEVKSQSQSETILKDLLKRGNSKNKPAHVYQPDGDIKYNIYKGFNDNLLEHLFGQLFYKVPSQYFTLYKNHIVIADNYKQLEQFLYSNMLHKTLKYNKTHQRFLENFSTRDNIFIFGEMEYLPHITQNIFTPLWDGITEIQKEALGNFYACGFQLSGTGDMVYATSYLQHLPNKSSEPETVWQSLLDSVAITKPTLVKNHNSNEREVIIQDASDNLYLMSNNGRMLWKKPLDGPILSEIVQIDYYKNNKLQYIFNTKNKIYILDRNGNHVANFPVKLPSTATNGLAVIDYDNNRNYRFFIACENRKVYLYNSKGNLVPGWKFKGSEGLVNQPLQHFRTSNKDYLVFSDDRKNYILDRRGNIRVPIKDAFIRNKYSPFFIQNINTPKAELITSSHSGAIKRIEIKTGTVSTNTLTKLEGGHKLNSFIQNGQIHYLISEPHKVSLFNNVLKKRFDYEFENEINLNVDLYQFSSQNIKFGISELQGDEIHLLNSDGEIYKGFPLAGKSRFSIGFLKSSSVKFNLIVAGANNYLYNYRVE